MILNAKLVDEAREIIEKKKVFWEKKLGVKFDKDGRVPMGKLSTFDESDWFSTVKANHSKRFNECFLKALDEMKVERFPLTSLTYDDYKRKRITVTTTKGRTQEKNIASFLQKAHDIWEKEYDMYRPFINHMRAIRGNYTTVQNGLQEFDKATNILKKFQEGNTYLAYDKLLREFQEKDLYISINPLDKLFASGGNGSNYSYTLTKFNTCWSNLFEKRDEGYEVYPVGCYSNPEAQIAIGSHLCAGMVIVDNGNKIEINGMTFYGMLQRSHLWLYDDGIFIENIYPDRYNRKRIEEVNSIIGMKTKIANPTRWTKVRVDGYDFDYAQWYRDFKSKIDGGRDIYLDRAAVNTQDGSVYVGPLFRNGNYGGTFRLPR